MRCCSFKRAEENVYVSGVSGPGQSSSAFGVSFGRVGPRSPVMSESLYLRLACELRKQLKTKRKGGGDPGDLAYCSVYSHWARVLRKISRRRQNAALLSLCRVGACPVLQHGKKWGQVTARAPHPRDRKGVSRLGACRVTAMLHGGLTGLRMLVLGLWSVLEVSVLGGSVTQQG